MARPFKATKEAVFEFLTKNMLNGKPVPPITSIREAVGGGSFSTIASFVDAWKNETVQLRPEDRVLTADDFPAPTYDPVLIAIREMVANASNPILAEKIKEKTQPVEEKLRIAEENLSAATEENARLTKDIEEARTTYEENVKKIADEKGKEISRLMDEFATRISSAAQEKAVLQKENEELRKELEALKNQVASTKELKI